MAEATNNGDEKPSFKAVKLDNKARAEIDARSAALLKEAEPRLRALDEAGRVTAADLAIRIVSRES